MCGGGSVGGVLCSLGSRRSCGDLTSLLSRVPVRGLWSRADSGPAPAAEHEAHVAEATGHEGPAFTSRRACSTRHLTTQSHTQSVTCRQLIVPCAVVPVPLPARVPFCACTRARERTREASAQHADRSLLAHASRTAARLYALSPTGSADSHEAVRSCCAHAQLTWDATLWNELADATQFSGDSIGGRSCKTDGDHAAG